MSSRGTDFFVIGVVKGGTTSLYDYLNQHPEIYLPPIKEINHFSDKDIDHASFLPGYAQDVDLDLERYFDKGMPEMIHIAHVRSEKDYARLYSPAGPEQIKGDISNSYMICPSSAGAIHSYNPNARIIVVLRNPIRRVWSQYLMNLREAKTNREDLLSELESDSKAVKTGWGANHQYLELGKYAEQLQRYYELFSAEQIHVVLFEEYVTGPQAELGKICKFLGVHEVFQFDTESKKNAASLPRNKALNQALVQSGIMSGAKKLVPRRFRQGLAKVLYSDKDLPEMSAEESDHLRSYYAEEVQKTGHLIKRDLGALWKEFESTRKP